jgi:putative hemolysin
MHDVLDALVGNTATSENFDYRIVKKNENSWVADAQFPLVEFLKYFDLDYQFDNKDNYTTLVGFFLNEGGGSPEVGDKIKVDDLELEIISKDKQRVDKILISKTTSTK